jgi:hypothetical protein
MTHAVCMNCGQFKFGAYVPCTPCGFRPETLLDLTMSELYSDRYVDDDVLRQLSNDVVNNQKVAREKVGSLNIEMAVYELLNKRLADQSFRDPLTLIKRAKDGLLRRELNVHLIGPDGYESHVSVRGKDLDKKTFDAVRSSGDGDLYLSYHYDQGSKKTFSISKKDWYILYDKMKLVERGGLPQNAYIAMLDGIYDILLDNYSQHGTIAAPKT